MTQPVDVCPTPCDEECTVGCHEWHEVAYKRDHQPHNCPSARTQVESS